MPRAKANSVRDKEPLVVVVGDVCLDRTRVGKPTRLSPEAPHTAVMEQIDTFSNPGMAANVAMNIAAQGVEVHLFSSCGNDDDGEMLQQQLEDGDVVGWLEPNAAMTSVKHRTVTDNGVLISRIDAEFIEPVWKGGIKDSSEVFLGKNPKFASTMANATAVVIADHAKGYLNPDVIRAILKLADKHNLPVVFDPKDWDNAAAAHGQFNVIMKPNLKELQMLAGNRHVFFDDNDIRHTCQVVVENMGIGGMILTRGDEGLLFVSRNTSKIARTEAKEVFDVVGAGDVVAATVAAQLARTPSNVGLFDIRVCNTLKQALDAATIAVTRQGVAVVSSKDLLTYRDKTRMSRTVNHLTRSMATDGEFELVDRVDIARRAGKTIVLTNGCFDLIHPGHVWSLQQAAAIEEDTFVVVLLNDDEGIRALKGAGRPIMPAKDRAYVLGGLSSVDCVHVFAQTQLTSTIAKVRPDVYMKGKSYDKGGDDVHDAIYALVTEAGGRVEYATIHDGCSTTNTLERINHNAKKST